MDDNDGGYVNASPTVFWLVVLLVALCVALPPLILPVMAVGLIGLAVHMIRKDLRR